MTRRKKNIHHMLSSRLLGADRVVLAFCVQLMMKRTLEQKITGYKNCSSLPSGTCTSEEWYTSTFKNSTKVQRKYRHSLLRNTTASSMTVEISGKRYRRQDEIGTQFCVTYDFDSEEDGSSVQYVTVIQMEQERIKIEDLDAYFEKKFTW